MVSEKLNYYVCLAPCISVNRNLKDLQICQLDYKSEAKDFSVPQVLTNLKKLKIINAISGRITPKFCSYTSKKQFLDELKKDTKQFTDDVIKETYKCVLDKITGGTQTKLFGH